MTSSSPKLHGLSLDGLLAEGLREATSQSPVPWEAPAPADLQGVLPRYEIVRLIGRGGMGAVYEARQVDLGRRVAVKVLPPELGTNDAFAERFRREARALGRLEHGNILEVFEFGESAAGHLFYSMPYVEGGDLGARLKRGPLPPREALRLVQEICAALEVAHAQGVIHRDLKPANILLTGQGTVKVADFGIAVIQDQPQERLTSTGLAVGSMDYVAPEQAAGTAVDTRSDLYSVGVICYEVLTGQLPRGIFDPPSKLNAAVDPAMDSVVHTAMQSDPARRYQSATDFRAALNRTGTGLGRGRRRWLTTVVAAALVVGAGLLFWWSGKTNPSPTNAVLAPASKSLAAGQTIIAWGQNEFGEGTAPPDLGEVRAIAAGDYFTLALRRDGTVAAWGRNDLDQTKVPTGLTGVESIATGGYHTLALRADGTVAAWGWNRDGQTNVPAGLHDVQAIAGGNTFSVALKKDGTLVAWGENTFGQCNVPEGLGSVRAIAAGDGFVLVAKRDGSVVTWGRTDHGVSTIPSHLTGVRTVAAGWHHCLAINADGTVVAWGQNDEGEATVPAGLKGVVAISGGIKHSLALKDDGTVVAWGIKDRTPWGDHWGQADVPTGLTRVKAIAAGFRHSAVLR